MKLTFYGGAGQVTGANYLLEFKDSSRPSGTRKILIDCGLHQGSHFCERHNYTPFPFNPKEVSEVFVSHAHIDHTGRLPKLVRDGFSGTVYATPPTREFAEALLLDSEHILAQEAERDKMPMIYSAADVVALMQLWQGIPYHKTIHLGSPHDGADVTLHSAGHILGSASVAVKAEGKTILFSGDLGNSPAPLIGPSEAPDHAMYVLMESAYGNRTHEDAPERKKKLAEVIVESMKAGGTLMIPAFALERTQILLMEMHDLLNQHKIPRVPIFIDSPLAIKLTAIYSRYHSYFKPEIAKRFEQREAIFSFPNLHQTLTTDESKAINAVPGPKIVIAGSGMSQGGRILHHEKRYLPDPKSALLIFGYQAEGSLGRQLLDGAPSVRIMGEDVKVRARIRAIGAYSAHADQPQLLSWLSSAQKSAKRVFLVQGERDAAEVLKEKIEAKLGMSVVIPQEGDTVVL